MVFQIIHLFQEYLESADKSVEVLLLIHKGNFCRTAIQTVERILYDIVRPVNIIGCLGCYKSNQVISYLFFGLRQHPEHREFALDGWEDF